VRGLAKVIVWKLQTNHRCLYLNSPAMVAGVRSALAALGVNVAHEVGKRTLILSSDTSHLVNGRFEVEQMLAMLSEAIAEALKDGFDGLWASGDMTWEFGNERNFEKLMEYECGLEEMFRQHPALSGICQYHRDTMPEESLQAALERHPAIYWNETLSRVNPFYASDGASDARWSPLKIKEGLDQLRSEVTE